VELRTGEEGPNASLMVKADDGPDGNATPDALFTTLFGAASTTTLESVGSSGGVFQVGADAGEIIQVNIRDIRSAALGTTTDFIADIDIADDASGALSIIDAAITQVSTQRGDLGAIQNRFEHTIANLSVTVENLSASESRIRDTDMAEEMMSFTRAQILQQAGTAMLAQANAVPQSVLQLLQ
jgi:flagellin